MTKKPKGANRIKEVATPPPKLQGKSFAYAGRNLSRARRMRCPASTAVSERPSRWQRGFRSGARPDLKTLMQAEANPRIDRVWMRRVEVGPVTEAHVILLVDLSGSMAGEKIACAAAAVSAIAEAFKRLNRLHWKIFGFQDKLIPIAIKGAMLDPAAIRSLMLMSSSRSCEITSMAAP